MSHTTLNKGRLATVRNEHEFIFLCMKRSGSNAIMNWVIHHFPDGSVHLLNTDPKTFALKPEVFKKKQEQSIFNYGMYQLSFDTNPYCNKKCLITRYEEVELTTDNIDRIESHNYGVSDNRLYVVPIRDPYNMTASRLHYKNMNIDAKYKRMMIQYYSYYLKIKEVIKNVVFINFNFWFKYECYRRDYANMLGLNFTDKGLHNIPKYGIGSSFDGMKYNGKAQSMNVLNRWKTYLYHDGWRKICFDEEIQKLSESIWGNDEFLKYVE